jgi:hypothetical protein
MAKKAPIETSTSKSLKPPGAAVRKRAVKTEAEVKPDADPVKALLDKLYEMATVDKNTSAAKIYLDYTLKQKGEDADALTPEEALRILREQQR